MSEYQHTEYDVVEPTLESKLLCAKICHTANKVLCLMMNEPALAWRDVRDSTLAGIDRILANPSETYEQNHEAWMAYRIAEGWKLGAVKDPVKKTHPCLMPWDMLPPYQRAKDVMFSDLVRTFFGLSAEAPKPVEEKIEETRIAEPVDLSGERVRLHVVEEIKRLFGDVEFGAKASRISDARDAPAYRTYALAAILDGAQDWPLHLAREMAGVLQRLRAAGATRIVSRLDEVTQVNVVREFELDHAKMYARMRLAGLTDDGLEVVLDDDPALLLEDGRVREVNE